MRASTAIFQVADRGPRHRRTPFSDGVSELLRGHSRHRGTLLAAQLFYLATDARNEVRGPFILRFLHANHGTRRDLLTLPPATC